MNVELMRRLDRVLGDVACSLETVMGEARELLGARPLLRTSDAGGM